MRRTQQHLSFGGSRKTHSGKFVIFLLMAAALGLFFFSKSHPDALQNARLEVAQTFSGITKILAVPTDMLRGGGSWLKEMSTLKEDNARLKKENERLREWKTTASELTIENGKLRQLMNFAPPGRKSYISARVALDTAGPFGKSAIIDVGKEGHVQDDLVVVDENGMVGRVLETGEKSARVLLITDANSRIPVMSENSRERAIAEGDNEGKIHLLYLPESTNIKIGERIVSTSDGGVLPPGLPVGTVTHVSKNNITVQPFMDAHRLEYVSVVDFGM